MEKSKSKGQPKNFLRFLLDEFILFRRDFYFESSIPSEILAEKILSLKIDDEVNKRKIIPRIQGTTDSWQFTLRYKRFFAGRMGGGSYITTAEAIGQIYTDNDGQSLIIGNIKLGNSYWMIIVLLLFSCFLFMLPASNLVNTCGKWFSILLAFGLVLSLFLSMYINRNELYSLIQEAVASAEGREILDA